MTKLHIELVAEDDSACRRLLQRLHYRLEHAPEWPRVPAQFALNHGAEIATCEVFDRPRADWEPRTEHAPGG